MKFHLAFSVLLFASVSAFAEKQATINLQSSGVSGAKVDMIATGVGSNNTGVQNNLAVYSADSEPAVKLMRTKVAQTGRINPGTRVILNANTSGSENAALSESEDYTILEVGISSTSGMGSCNVFASVSGTKPRECNSGSSSEFPTNCTFRCHTIAGTSCPSTATIESMGNVYTQISASSVTTGSVPSGSTRCCYLNQYLTRCNTSYPGNSCGGKENRFEQINKTVVKGVRATGGMSTICTVI